MKPDGLPAPLLRRRTPLDDRSPAARAALDRLPGSPSADRKPDHPTFNSAV